MTEEEQLENIKKWWKKYSNMITIALSILLLSFSAYKYWHWQRAKATAQASSTYEQMMLAFANQNSKDASAYANVLIHDYNNTIYGDAAKLTKAKLLINQDDLKEAKALLLDVSKNSKMNPLKQIAKIRIARLLTAEKGYDEALSELAVIDDEAYKPLINELKGDIYAATGHYQQAILSYKEAISEARTHGMGNLFLEMKTNELAAVTQVINLANGTVQSA